MQIPKATQSVKHTELPGTRLSDGSFCLYLSHTEVTCMKNQWSWESKCSKSSLCQGSLKTPNTPFSFSVQTWCGRNQDTAGTEAAICTTHALLLQQAKARTAGAEGGSHLAHGKAGKGKEDTGGSPKQLIQGFFSKTSFFLFQDWKVKVNIQTLLLPIAVVSFSTWLGG